MAALFPIELRMAASRGAFAVIAQMIVSNAAGGAAPMEDAAVVGGSVMLADYFSRTLLMKIEGKKAKKAGVRTTNQLLVEPALAGGLAAAYDMGMRGQRFDPLTVGVVAAYDVAGGALARFAGVGQAGQAGIDKTSAFGF